MQDHNDSPLFSCHFFVLFLQVLLVLLSFLVQPIISTVLFIACMVVLLSIFVPSILFIIPLLPLCSCLCLYTCIYIYQSMSQFMCWLVKKIAERQPNKCLETIFWLVNVWRWHNAKMASHTDTFCMQKYSGRIRMGMWDHNGHPLTWSYTLIKLDQLD